MKLKTFPEMTIREIANIGQKDINDNMQGIDLKVKYGVYAFIEKKTDKVLYIGKDSNIFVSMRCIEHLRKCNKNKQKINKWLQENKGKWKYEVIAICLNKEWMNNIELTLIREFKQFEQCEFNKVEE